MKEKNGTKMREKNGTKMREKNGTKMKDRTGRRRKQGGVIQDKRKVRKETKWNKWKKCDWVRLTLGGKDERQTFGLDQPFQR